MRKNGEGASHRVVRYINKLSYQVEGPESAYYDPGKLHSRRFDDSTGGKVAPTIVQRVDALILPFVIR